MTEQIPAEERLGESAWDWHDAPPACPECGGTEWTHTPYDRRANAPEVVECDNCGETI